MFRRSIRCPKDDRGLQQEPVVKKSVVPVTAVRLHPVRKEHTATDRKTLTLAKEKGSQAGMAVKVRDTEPADLVLHLTADLQVVVEKADLRVKTVN